LLLSLLPLSCMVIPIRDLANKHSFTSAFNSTSSQIARTLAYKVINIDNFNNIRGRSTSPSKISPSISSTTSSILYYKKMEINNNLPDKKFTEPVDSFQLPYKNNSEEDIPISEATDNSSNRNQQYASNKALALKNILDPF